ACRAGLPLTVTLPAVAGSRSPTTRSSVDLPHPDGPMSDTNSPVPTVRSMPSSATVIPARDVNVLSTPWSSTIGGAEGGATDRGGSDWAVHRSAPHPG